MDAQAVAQRLVALRGLKPREEVSISLGISTNALAAYENGERMPRDEVKLSLASYYGVSIESLFFEPVIHAS